jgi:hypothetical protein
VLTAPRVRTNKTGIIRAKVSKKPATPAMVRLFIELDSGGRVYLGFQLVPSLNTTSPSEQSIFATPGSRGL